MDFGVSMFALPGTFVSSESLAHRGLALLLKSVAIHLSLGKGGVKALSPEASEQDWSSQT